MPFPAAERVTFQKNPLNEVICQLRFPPILKIDHHEPGRMSMVFRSALRSFKAIFWLIASMSRVLLLLDFDHRQRIQFFRAREYAFRVQWGSDIKRSQKAKSCI
jgi:hypothetical protein